jgi:transcriptional regulator with PAS, ATPase and Fis domain
MFVARTVQLNDKTGRFKNILAAIKVISREVESESRRLVAESPEMRQVVESVRRIAASGVSTVLLEGEEGSGKDLSPA